MLSLRLLRAGHPQLPRSAHLLWPNGLAADRLLRPCYRAPASQRVRAYALVPIKIPAMAESLSEGTLKQWSKKVGDRVEKDEELVSVETDKIDVAVLAPAAGVITEILVEEESTVLVDQKVGMLDTSANGESKPESDSGDAGQEPARPAEPAQPAQPSEPPTTHDTKQADSAPPKYEPSPQAQSQPPSPSTSSTPSQQSSQASPPTQHQQKPSSPQKSEPERVSAEHGREERRVKMNRMRLRIAERLKQSQNTAASLTTFNEVDMSALMDFRKLYRDDVLKRSGVKLGFMGAFARACVLAMRDLPAVNASIEGPDGGDTIVYHDYIDLSVAVATEKGLVTPVVRNAESLDIIGIERSISELGKKARDGKLTIEDMAGGTFTISNGGVFGSLMGTPIINLPQAAVLGLHAIKERPVVVDGRIEIRPMMYLALTYDHRLLDGREAVQFLVKVKDYIEDPRRMLL